MVWGQKVYNYQKLSQQTAGEGADGVPYGGEADEEDGSVDNGYVEDVDADGVGADDEVAFTA